MHLRRWKNRYQQLIMFERGRVTWLREGEFSFCDIAKWLSRNVSSVHDYWQKWTREGTASRKPRSGSTHGPTEREDRLFGSIDASYYVCSRHSSCGWHHSDTTNSWKSVNSRKGPSQTPYNTRITDSKALSFAMSMVSSLEDGVEISCFLMKAGFILVPVMAVCWL